MPIRLIDFDSPEYWKMIKLRDAILRKPLGLTFSAEDLEKERHDIFIGVFDEDEILGCCVLTPENGDTVRLRQMAVAYGLQQKGIGTTIMAYAEGIARDRRYKYLVMHARAVATGFYERLGYTIVGDQFTEVNIPHYMMGKKL